MKKTTRQARCPKCGRMVNVHETRFHDLVLATHSVGAESDESARNYDTDALGYQTHNRAAATDDRVRCPGSGEPA